MRPSRSGRYVTNRRAAWRARLPLPCLRCGRPVSPEEPWDLDHIEPIAFGGSPGGEAWPAHRACNRRHGQRIGSAKRASGSSGYRVAILDQLERVTRETPDSASG